MTANKASLQALFETGDVPTGADYSNLIDSCLNLVETSAQNMLGALIATEVITPRVSAANLNVTSVLSAQSLVVNNYNTVSATSINTPSLTASAATITGSLNVGASVIASAAVFGVVSAASLNVTGDVSAATGTVYASAMRSTNGFIGGVGVVSAAGTTQGTAATLSNVVNRGKGIVDGTTTGFTPLANRAGLVQYLFNEGVSANLWPPTGGTINGLAANAAFALATSAMVTIVHLTASAYAVK